MRPSKSLLAALILPGLSLWLLDFLLFAGAGRDDGYITLHAARNLLAQGAFVDGMAGLSEMSSSLLQVLLVALASFLVGCDPVIAARPLALLAGFAAAGLAARWAWRQSGPYAGALVVLATAQGSYAYWSMSTLENSYTVLALVLLVLTSVRAPRPRGLTLFCLALVTVGVLTVRPEGVVYALLAALLTALHCPRGEGEKRLRRWSVLLLPVLLFAVLTGWRLASFGLVLPNPALAKSLHLDLQRLLDGGRYLAGSFADPGLAMTLTLLCWGSLTWFFAPRSRSLPSTLGLGLSWTILGGALLSGGDWMEGHRRLTALIPLVWGFVTPPLLSSLVSSPTRWVLAAGLFFCCLGSVASVATTSTSLPLWTTAEEYASRLQAQEPVLQHRVSAEVKGLRLGEVLANDPHSLLVGRDVGTLGVIDCVLCVVERHLPPPVLLLTGPRGFLPYWLTRWHPELLVLDRFGLGDATFLRCPAVRAEEASNLGLALPVLKILTNLGESCGLPRPELVLEHDDPEDLRRLERHGYRILFLVHGLLPTPSPWVPSRHAIQYYLALREDLYQLTAVELEHDCALPRRLTW